MRKPTIGFTILDLREKASHTENFYPLYVVHQIIMADTGRSLSFESLKSLARYSELFKLVRFPDPVGFTVVAKQFIPMGTFLFPYGGEKLSKREGAARNQNLSAGTYLLNAIDERGQTHTQDAAEFGDLGSLLPHLPSQEFLNTHFDLSEASTIQSENIATFYGAFENETGIYFATTQNIYPGTVIGFDYGTSYWGACQQSPLYFKKGEPKLVTVATSNPEIVLINPDSENTMYKSTKTGKSTPIHLPLLNLIISSGNFQKKELDCSTRDGGIRLLLPTANLVDLLTLHLFSETHSKTDAKTPQKYNASHLFLPVKPCSDADSDSPQQTEKKAATA